MRFSELHPRNSEGVSPNFTESRQPISLRPLCPERKNIFVSSQYLFCRSIFSRWSLWISLILVFLFSLVTVFSVDPFTRKDWYDVKAPSMFNVRNVGKTLVNRTQGTKIASDGLKGRVYEVSQADIHGNEDAFRKFKWVSYYEIKTLRSLIVFFSG